MEIDKVFNNDVDGVADNLFSAVKNSVSEIKAMQQRKAAENVQLVIRALKKLETELRETNEDVANQLALRIASIKDGRDGNDGKNGKDGRDGKAGRDGKDGNKGDKGADGRDGVDGVDGISVVNANIDFDGSLIISLSDGREINVGEVVAPDLAERIKVISTMSTNGAVGIKDEGTSISTGVKNINFVGATVTATNSGDDVTVNVSAGTGTVTSVAATVPTFLSVTGSPVTTSGTLAISLSGTALPVANGGTGVTTSTGTSNVVLSNSPTLVTPALGTPSALVGTNITGTATSFNINGTVGATTPAAGTFTSITDSGNLTFTGTGNRITGDFSNATRTSQIAFQTSTANSVTNINALPSGTQTQSNFYAYTATDPDNSAFIRMGAGAVTNTVTILQSNAVGTGTVLPMTFYVGTSERARIDTSGNVGIGTANTPSNKDTVTPKLIVNGAGVAGSMQVVRNTTVGGGGAILELTATRGSDVNSYTILQSGDGVGSINFGGADGTQFTPAASISSQVDGTPGANDMPGRLVFSTTADGASAVTERMRIDSSGNVGIGATAGTILDVYKASGNPYFRVYTGTGSVQGYMQALDSTYVKMGSLSSHDLGLVTGGTEAVRITTGGNVGIGTTAPNASAILDAQSTTKGVRMPNMTTTQKNAISSPAAGLMVFDTTLAKLCVYSGSAWQTITST